MKNLIELIRNSIGSASAVTISACVACSGMAIAGGATEKETLTLTVSSDKKAKSIELVFKADDKSNCRYNNTMLLLKKPTPSKLGGILTPPLGSLALETSLGACKRFPDRSHGQITLTVGNELPQIPEGYWAIEIDGKRHDKVLSIGQDTEVELIDQDDLPQ